MTAGTDPSRDRSQRLNHSEILEILEIVRESNLEYFELRVGDTVIIASTDAAITANSSHSISHFTASSQMGDDEQTPRLLTKSLAPQAPADPARSFDDVDEIVEIAAPVVGIFYTAPSPGAPPFAELGAVVAAGTTLGLVEVMKMFNSVTAPCDGVVLDVLADSGDFVEYNQPLIRMKRT